MKRTKNAARILTLVLVLCMVFLPLIACTKTQSVNGYCTVVIATEPKETVYKVNLDKIGTVDNGLMSILDYLKENKGLTYESENSAYGAFLTKLLTLEQGPNFNPYIAVYTSVEADCGGVFTDKTYKDTKLGYSILGVSSMTVQADAVYYFVLEG